MTPEAATHFDVQWIDSGQEPRCAPDPRYPTGIDVDLTGGIGPPLVCRVELPYPARRCGAYRLKCLICGLEAMISTAGRADDPRSVTMPCRL